MSTKLKLLYGLALVLAGFAASPGAAQSMRPGPRTPARTSPSGSTSGVPVVSVDQVEQYLAYARNQRDANRADREDCRTRYYSALSIRQCEQSADRLQLYWDTKIAEYERLAEKMRAP